MCVRTEWNYSRDGHPTLRLHLPRLGLHAGDTGCRICGRSQRTTEHLLWHCEPIGPRRGLFGGTEPGKDGHLETYPSTGWLVRHPLARQRKHNYSPEVDVHSKFHSLAKCNLIQV